MEALGLKGEVRAGTGRNVEPDKGRNRGVADAISILVGTAGTVGGVTSDPLASVLGSVSADLSAGCSSMTPGGAGVVAGSEIGEGGTSTIAMGAEGAVTVAGAGSGE